jgi:hypothetical protein
VEKRNCLKEIGIRNIGDDAHVIGDALDEVGNPIEVVLAHV